MQRLEVSGALGVKGLSADTKLRTDRQKHAFEIRFFFSVKNTVVLALTFMLTVWVDVQLTALWTGWFVNLFSFLLAV